MNLNYKLNPKKLETGTIIELTTGDIGILINETVIMSELGGIVLDEITFENSKTKLNKKNNTRYEAKAVYEVKKDAELRASMNFWLDQQEFIREETSEKIWEDYTPPIRITKEDIEKKLGYPIDIIK